MNYFFNQGQPFDGTQWNVRLDQNFRGGKDKVYGMYERIDQKLGDLSQRSEEDASTPSQNKYFSVNYVHLFNPGFSTRHTSEISESSTASPSTIHARLHSLSTVGPGHDCWFSV